MLITTATVANLIDKKEYGKAQEQLTKLILIYPNMDELYDLYSYCQKCLQKIDKTVKPAQAEPNKYVKSWKSMLPHIQNAIDKGNFQQAINILKLFQSSSLEKKQYYECADIQEQTKIFYTVAVCYFLQDDTEQAKEYYLRALDTEISALNIQSPEAISLLIKKKEYERALEEINNFLKGSACHVQLCYQRYKIFNKLGEELIAKQCLDDVLTALDYELKAAPFYAPLYKNYADILIEKGEFENALIKNGIAIALHPGSYAYHMQRAEIYARNGQKNEALEILSLTKNSNMSNAAKIRPALLAKVYDCLGDCKTAEQYYKAPAIHPLLRYDELASFYKRRSRNKELKTLQCAQRKEPCFQNRVSESDLIALI